MAAANVFGAGAALAAGAPAGGGGADTADGGGVAGAGFGPTCVETIAWLATVRSAAAATTRPPVLTRPHERARIRSPLEM